MSDKLPIFTDELRDKIDVFLASVIKEPPTVDQDVAQLLTRAGIAIIDTSRRQALVDLIVYEGVLWQLAQAGRYSRDQAIDICATSRDGYSRWMIPTEIPLRLDAVMCASDDTGRAALLRTEDDAECRRREAAKLEKAA